MNFVFILTDIRIHLNNFELINLSLIFNFTFFLSNFLFTSLLDLIFLINQLSNLFLIFLF